MGYVLRREADGWHVDIVRLEGSLLWSGYAFHVDRLRAILCAEQRYLAEQVGAGAMPGDTYADKAEERIRRWRELGQ